MANLNKVKKYHFIYKTTNLLNDKYYVGMHSTSNLKDGYLGSGKRLRYSIRKYGVENFKLEILEWFDSREALVNRETQLVNEDLLKDEMCLNLKPGGSGGWSSEQQRLNAEKSNQKQSWLRENDKEWSAKRTKQLKENGSMVLNRLWKDSKLTPPDWNGRVHSNETKKKLSEIKKNTGMGSDNSQFGTCWITNGNESKKIYKGDLIPQGWKLGRKI
jgi:group I intron endonuclease